LAPLLSITTFSSNPFALIICLKKAVAASSSRRAESVKSRVSPNLSTAQYKYTHWPFTFI
jgi:hypothetical protein